MPRHAVLLSATQMKSLDYYEAKEKHTHTYWVSNNSNRGYFSPARWLSFTAKDHGTINKGTKAPCLSFILKVIIAHPGTVKVINIYTSPPFWKCKPYKFFYQPWLWEQPPLMITVSFKCLFSPFPLFSLCHYLFPVRSVSPPNTVLTSSFAALSAVGETALGERARCICARVCFCGRTYNVPHVWPAATVRSHVAPDGNSNHGIWLPAPSPSIIDESNIYSVTCVL